MTTTSNETVYAVLNFLNDNISAVDTRVSTLEDIAETDAGRLNTVETKLTKVPFLDSVNTQDEFVEAVANSVITILNGDGIAY